MLLTTYEIFSGAAIASSSGAARQRKRIKRIGDRDGWICWICQGPIDPQKRNNAHYGPSIDHVIRRADGGSGDDSNLKIAHRKCNSERHTPPKKKKGKPNGPVVHPKVVRGPKNPVDFV